MRSAVIAAAFAAAAIAVPMEKEKRAVYVTNTDVAMVYVTNYVTVTADGAAPKEAAPTKDSSSPSNDYGNYNWGNKPHWWGGPHKAPVKHHHHKPTGSQPEPTTSDWAPAPSSEAPAPSSEAPAPSSEAPAPKPSKAPVQSSEAPSEPAPSAAPAPASGYQGIVLQQHNLHRKNHSAPDIKWSASLQATAQKIADSCQYAHDTTMDGGGYGQNIAAGVSDDQIDRVITNMFYDSEVQAFANNYGNPSPGGFEEWGHFSQMVWVNTVEVACVTKKCDKLENTGGNVPPYFTVCNYSPPGNVKGRYDINVNKPVGMAPVYASGDDGW